MLKLLFFIVFIFLSACQTADKGNLRTKSDYRPSRELLSEGRVVESQKNLPQTVEFDEFITAMETAWLNFLSGTPDFDQIERVSKNLEDRKTIRFSHEAKKFFLKEVPDGSYLPAEHEVILFHIIAGYSYAQYKRPEKARVEAKRAARYLQGHFGDYAGDFDDPGIRMLLAGLWLYCDDWQHARVDFRVAAELDHRYAWAAKMAEGNTAPDNYTVLFKGVGPEVMWDPDHHNSNRWDLKFAYTEDQEMPFSMDTLNSEANIGFLSTTESWYTRHLERDSAPRTALDNIRHGVEVTAGVIGSFIVATAAIVGSIIVVATAIVVSAALIIASGDPVTGVDISANLISSALPVAEDIATSGIVASNEVYAISADESEYYRYVRFLPSYLGFFGVNGVDSSANLGSGRLVKFITRLTSISGANVNIFFLPRDAH